MMARLKHQLEIRGDAATLYLAGALHHQDLPRLRAVCDSLPAPIRILRVDLHAVRALGSDATSALRALLHDWRTARHGEFRLSLSTTHLIATLEETERREATPVLVGCTPRHALMGTYL